MEIYSAFVIGLLGSLHCIGMCGPIALALPVSSESGFSFYAGRLLYNIGRITSYAIIGLIFGLIGKSIALTGFQQGLSILLGLVIILTFLLPAKVKARLSSAKFTMPVKKLMGSLFKQKTLASFYLIGALNGFLPCGFVYIGVAGAVATGDPLSGALFMAFFGLGTAPAMFAATLFGKFIDINLRRRISKAVPVLAIILAVVFILRGMNLGIPYLSPQINTVHATPECCH